MALIVDHLTRTYAGPANSVVTAVDDFSVEITGGEIVGLIGPNGAGKTTSLRSIAGILLPSSGRIAIEGQPAERRPGDLAKPALECRYLREIGRPGGSWRLLSGFRAGAIR